jgi:hypothetical protein
MPKKIFISNENLNEKIFPKEKWKFEWEKIFPLLKIFLSQFWFISEMRTTTEETDRKIKIIISLFECWWALFEYMAVYVFATTICQEIAQRVSEGGMKRINCYVPDIRRFKYEEWVLCRHIWTDSKFHKNRLGSWLFIMEIQASSLSNERSSCWVDLLEMTSQIQIRLENTQNGTPHDWNRRHSCHRFLLNDIYSIDDRKLGIFYI